MTGLETQSDTAERIMTPIGRAKRKAEDILTISRKRTKSDIVKRLKTESASQNAAPISASLNQKIYLMEVANASRVFFIKKCITDQKKGGRKGFMKLTR